MDKTRVSYGVLFVLLLLLASEGMATETQGIWRHPCRVASRRFHGMCMSDRNCASVCKTEGHEDGECEGLRRRCLCAKRC